MFRHLFFPLIASLAATVSAQNSTSSAACNNSPDLCERAYNNVTYLGAHDSPFLRDASTSYSESGNQFYNSTVQLSAGVRLLTAQVHNTNSSNPSAGEWHLCHTSCSLLDAGRLRDWLTEIKNWLAANKNEVVTILLVNSDDADASELAAEYEAAGIEDYVYTPPSITTAPSEWPTLQTLINNGTRLLNFVASLDASSNTVAPYLMDEFTFIFENPYDNSSPSNFTCTPDRPSSVSGNIQAALSKNMMPLMNHFLYNNTGSIFGIDIETPNVDAVNVTNGPSGSGTGNLGDSAVACASTYGRAPTYLLVDFFNAGPAIATVDTLNGISNPVGRTSVGDSVRSRSSTSGAGGKSVSNIALVAALLASVTIFG
ncbi:hypothetical protein H2203_008192 [Taxawa tesnikishii (nom. ined.)]|nr:hypothetical protein H2203_008192 [Dothideales sp. JES 119]